MILNTAARYVLRHIRRVDPEILSEIKVAMEGFHRSRGPNGKWMPAKITVSEAASEHA